MNFFAPFETVIAPELMPQEALRHYPAATFPSIHPVHWLHSHFAVGGWSGLQRLSGMLTAHMTQIAPHNGFAWHPHRGLEIYTWVLEGELYHEDSTGGKGVIRAGELQRMFSGDWIEHQELNVSDAPTRVIQIWFAADPAYRELEPHYQQVGAAELPVRSVDDGMLFNLIGDDSPMKSHVEARLVAGQIGASGKLSLEAPLVGESLLLYVTDGVGSLEYQHQQIGVGQYDVVLARPDMPSARFTAQETGLHFLGFYLPEFLPY